MRTTQTNRNADLDFSIDAAPLLDQLDAKLTASEMQNGAMCVAGRFEWAADQPAQDQADLVARMSIAELRNLDPADPNSISVAVGAAALLMAAKLGPATASERIRRAAGILSQRYQSDW